KIRFHRRMERLLSPNLHSSIHLTSSWGSAIRSTNSPTCCSPNKTSQHLPRRRRSKTRNQENTKMTFSFDASLSGLNASSNALNVVGNNIANANTVGFRSSTITFMDVFANRYGIRLNGAGNGLQIGNGV